MYAAIGTDGTREVVWGLGETEETAEAEAEAEGANSDVDPQLIRTVPVTDEIAQRIRAGEVGAADLGI